MSITTCILLFFIRMKLNGGNIEGKKFLDDRSWHLTSNKREREQESSFLRHLARTNIFSLFVESARWSEKKPFKGVEAACSERDEICMHKGNPVTSLFYHVFLIIISFCEHFDGTLWISFHHPKKRVLGTREEVEDSRESVWKICSLRSWKEL